MGSMTPQLELPSQHVHQSFLAAMAEFQAEGRGSEDDHSMIGSEIRSASAVWDTPEGFAKFVEGLRAEALEETPRDPRFVPSTTLWWVVGDEYLGRIAIRHRLNANLLEVGGHIGYDVRPSARQRGYATAMLKAALPIARDLGIDRVLVTCDDTNVASRLVIERNGGVLEDIRQDKMRYWIDL